MFGKAAIGTDHPLAEDASAVWSYEQQMKREQKHSEHKVGLPERCHMLSREVSKKMRTSKRIEAGKNETADKAEQRRFEEVQLALMTFKKGVYTNDQSISMLIE